MQPGDSPKSSQPVQLARTPAADGSLEAAEQLSSCRDGASTQQGHQDGVRAAPHHKEAMAPAADLSSEASEHASVRQDGLAGVKHLLLEGVIQIQPTQATCCVVQSQNVSGTCCLQRGTAEPSGVEAAFCQHVRVQWKTVAAVWHDSARRRGVPWLTQCMPFMHMTRGMVPPPCTGHGNAARTLWYVASVHIGISACSTGHLKSPSGARLCRHAHT